VAGQDYFLRLTAFLAAFLRAAFLTVFFTAAFFTTAFFTAAFFTAFLAFFLATIRPPLNRGLRRTPSRGFRLPKAVESGSTYNSKTTFRLLAIMFAPHPSFHVHANKINVVTNLTK
jgi:hypothetical protein